MPDKAEKASMPHDILDAAKSTPVIQAWFEIVQLKQLYRKGWLERGVDPMFCETVAEHTFGNAMLCLLLLPHHPELDSLKVLRMALVHDVGEAYVGDITPNDKVPAEEKKQLEQDAIEKIFAKLPANQSLVDDWHEYEAQETEEARFVKQIDRFEFAMQASIYQHQGKVDATKFLAAVEAQLTSPVLLEQIAALKSL